MHHPLRYAGLAFLLSAVPACGSETPYDSKNREIAWTYGPTTGGATRVHLTATGTKGPGAIAKGWKCRLVDGKRVTVNPFELAQSHELFGKVAINLGLFDKNGKQIETIRTEAITAQNATFSLEITEAVSKQLCDAVIWFVKA